MKIYRSSREAGAALSSPAVAIGNFDGIHLGHRALFDRALALGKRTGSPAVALTFHPHPARFFNPDLAPPLLCTEEQKVELMEAAGLHAVVIEPFDADLASLPAEAFVARVLHGDLGLRHVVVGRDFAFGKGRAGRLGLLRRMGRELGFEAHGVEPVGRSGIRASSTKVRNFLLVGQVRGAAMLLGRPYTVRGVVVEGKRRGRTIGIPTANIATHNELVPRRGVYAGRLRLLGGAWAPSVISVGTNPTFGRATVMTLEVHVLDFSGDIYGQRLDVAFCKRLRDQRRFTSVESLVTAIHEDIRRARGILADA